MSEFVIEATAGAAGAVVAALATYPMSIATTIAAVRKPEQDLEQGSPPPIVRFLRAIHEVYASDGWKGFYNGLKPTLLGTALSQGVYFYFYSLLKDLLADDRGRFTVPRSMAVAYLAGSLNVILTNPIWVIATRMQLEKSRRGGSIWKQISNATTRTGYKWALKGVLPSLVLVCNPAIQYTIYELLMRIRKRQVADQTVQSVDVFWISALSKIVATFATYPLFVIKSRIQTYSDGTRESKLKSWEVIPEIYEKEGLSGFYNGLSTKCMQSVLAAAIMMVVKEKVTKLLTSFKK